MQTKLTPETVSTSPTSIFIMGPPLTGKTRSLITLARWLQKQPHTKDRPIWYMDLSNASQSFLSLAVKEGFFNIEVFTYPRQQGDKIDPGAKTAHNSEPFMGLLKDINSLYDMKPTDPKFPSCIILDDLTNLSEIVMEFVVAMSGSAGGVLGESQAHYGLYASKMTEIRKSLDGLPLITVFLGHDNIIKDDLSGGTMIVPYLKGRVLPPTWCKDFTVVLYTCVEMKDGRPSYQWQTRPDARLRSAGTRFKEDLPARVEQDFKLVL